ncbi:MAG: 2-amino-4-hydroxy-6-hydroxymethyldihydropteridine diphosphokinase [Actinomycetota bacterium]|nr:2-amino-4-hydroxy-6-hydroxymethyldihydropteridine diphosphokinase [Actinomycetota bacterium]
MIVIFGLGSNLGDREAHLRGAVKALQGLDPGLVLSSLFETEPVGGPPQGTYLNCAVRLETELAPLALLSLAHRLEREAGRVRSVANGPRTLDVDLLVVGDVRRETPELTLPHPRMHERAFVLAPLEEIAPELVPDGWRERLGGRAQVDSEVRRVGNLVLG